MYKKYLNVEHEETTLKCWFVYSV